RPVLAYAGIARPTAATVQRERQASILRNQSQASGSASFSSVSASNPSPKRKKPRLSGPPRSFSNAVSSLNEFSEVPSAAPTTVHITVGILPKVVRGSLLLGLILSGSENNDPHDASPPYVWKHNRDIESAQFRLKSANLVFDVDVSAAGPIFEEINSGFLAHCQRNNIIFVSPSTLVSNSALGSTPNTMPWVLTGPKGRVGNARTWVEDPKGLTAFTFTVAALRAAPFSNTPNHLSSGIFIFIGARCLVFLLTLRLIAASRAAFFTAFCPQQTLTLNLDATPVLVLVRVLPQSLSRMLRCSLHPTKRPSNLLHMQTIDGPNGDSVLLAAPSVDCAARVLIAFCIWLHCVGDPPQVKFKEVLEEQFPAPRPTLEGILYHVALFSLRVLIGPGIGDGPRAEVVAHAVKILLDDPAFWTECGDFKTLCLHPSVSPFPRRSAIFKATGLLLLLHYVHIGAPTSVSPFLLYTVFSGRKTASRFDLEFLARFVSPPILRYIRNLHFKALDQPLYASQLLDCEEYQYLINIPGFAPSTISPSRTQDEQDGICAAVISFSTVGYIDIEHHPDFHSVSDGFNVSIACSAYDKPHHVLEWFDTPCRNMLLVSYDLRVKSPATILSHLTFTQVNAAADPYGENVEVVKLIQVLITHYLTELGHPELPNRVVDAILGPNRDDGDLSTVRARLFLKVTTGLVNIPVDPNWNIDVCLLHSFIPPLTFVQVSIEHDWNETNAVPKASFQACFRRVTITNNHCFRELLVEKPEAGSDTIFGRWFHGQALSSREAYTFA
ncbi:hypothetical protein R3P38DRAFT_2496194, partial [Favolaschia claudopus]